MTTPNPSPTPSEQSEAPQASTADVLLIERLPAVLAAALPADGSPGDAGSAADAENTEVHAEALHQLCLADGLLELLDWTHQGVGADPLACFWLAGLRWHRLVTGGFPAAAPCPPSRSVDEQLSAQLGTVDAGRPHGLAPLSLRTGTEAPGVDGLASGEMAYPTTPAQPERDDPAVLLRVVPLALVPYVDDTLRAQWVRQALALTHGHPRVLDRARSLVQLLHRAASAPAAELAEQAETLRDELDELLTGAAGDAAVDAAAADTLRRQLQALLEAAPSSTADDGDLPAALTELVAAWRRVTRPAG
ncbi:ADP-ribosylglycohydrolase family protein [Nesterenkonia halobia]|uniref:Uncharacterized protein n=1 Tax=Nesterenkonia halobia TaxID=37922 RepID=A0ABP6RFX3_9MICC